MVVDSVPLLLSDARADFVSRASVAMDEQGNFVVAWQADVVGSYDIYAKRFSANGIALGSTFLVNTISAGQQQNVSVASNGARRVCNCLGWESTIADQSISGRRLCRGWHSLGSGFAVATSDQFAFQPSIAINDDGDFVVQLDYVFWNLCSDLS